MASLYQIAKKVYLKQNLEEFLLFYLLFKHARICLLDNHLTSS